MAETWADESIRQQIAINAARTPTERFQALCDLLDAARALAPDDPESRARRARVQAARNREKERLRDEFRRIIAAQRADAAARVPGTE
ncbi:MAG: hypothetical protein AMXMBFR47_41680 [Planctomycetota bacterium]